MKHECNNCGYGKKLYWKKNINPKDITVSEAMIEGLKTEEYIEADWIHPSAKGESKECPRCGNKFEE